MCMPNKLPKWKTTSSKYIVHDRWLKLRADSCTTPTGHEINPFYVMEYPDWASCLVLSDDNEATLLRHYRHGIDAYVLELVALTIDNGETPETAARRELEEEIGLVNAEVHLVGTSYPNPAMLTNKHFSFVALGGTFGGNKQFEPGADFEIVKMPFDELLEITKGGKEVLQSMHLSNIFFAVRFLKEQGYR